MSESQRVGWSNNAGKDLASFVVLMTKLGHMSFYWEKQQPSSSSSSNSVKLSEAARRAVHTRLQPATGSPRVQPCCSSMKMHSISVTED